MFRRYLKEILEVRNLYLRGKLVDKYRNKIRQSKRLLTENSTTSSTDQENELCKLMSVSIYVLLIYFCNHYICIICFYF